MASNLERHHYEARSWSDTEYLANGINHVGGCGALIDHTIDHVALDRKRMCNYARVSRDICSAGATYMDEKNGTGGDIVNWVSASARTVISIETQQKE